MIVRTMEPRDLGAVETIHRLCHPTWPAYEPTWWFAHPTLVGELDGCVIGTTSFSLSRATDRDFIDQTKEVMYGHGVSVHPEWRGRGFGWTLAEARHRAARVLGVGFFLGMTWAENRPMLRIFERQGLTRHRVIPGFYPHNQPPADGQMWTGGVH